MMNIKGVLLQWFIIFLDKKRLLEQLKILNKYESYMNTLNKELAEELHRPIIRIFNKRKENLKQRVSCRITQTSY